MSQANAIATPKTITAQQLMDYVCAAETRKEALGYCQDITDERDRLNAVNADLLTVVEIAYTILGDVRHQWAGRHTEEGQGALVAMREVIAKATGREPQEVQDDYGNRNIAKARA